MKKNNLIFLVLISLIYLNSCATIKEGFSPEKNSTDEFFVEKKAPLVMPPDYNELPLPNNNDSLDEEENEKIKVLIGETNTQQEKEKYQDKSNNSLENNILDKIKK
tara:strand:- start:8128 stop:8445 length:318 start_codon:yes stop_codon:yes gene_type:complete